MAIGRMLKKNICYDERVAQLTLKASFLYTWIIPHLDIEGRIAADSHFLKGSIIPYVNEISIKDIPNLIAEIVSAGLAVHYGNTIMYLQYNGFKKNQYLREDRETPSLIPPPELIRSKSGGNAGVAPEASGHTPDLIPPKLREVKLIESNITIEQENPPPAFKNQDLTNMFDRIWIRYPRREGKSNAFKHFKATVKTEADWLAIKVALENYKDHLEKEKIDAKYIKQGSTWFNQWSDWQTDPTAPNEHTKHLRVLQKSIDQ